MGLVTIASVAWAAPLGATEHQRAEPEVVRLRVALGDEAEAWFRIQVPLGGSAGLRAIVRAPGGSLPDPIEPGDLAFRPHRWVAIEIARTPPPSSATVPVRVTVRVPVGTPAGTYAARAEIVRTAGSSGVHDRGSGTPIVVLIVVPGRGGHGVTDLAPAPTVDTALVVGWDGPFEPSVASSIAIATSATTSSGIGGVATMRSWPGGGLERRRIDLMRVPAGGQRIVRVSWERVPLFGPVTVTVEMVEQRGPADLVPTVVQATVWVVPWHLIAPLAGVSIGCWGAIRRVRRRRRRGGVR